MFILVGLGLSVVGGTILGLGLYAWDRYQERVEQERKAQ